MTALVVLVRRLFAPPYAGRHALGVPVTRRRAHIETWAQATWADIAAKHQLNGDRT